MNVSTMVLVGRCQPWTPPSPIPTVPSSQMTRTSSQRSHRIVSTFSIFVGFTVGYPLGVSRDGSGAGRLQTVPLMATEFNRHQPGTRRAHLGPYQTMTEGGQPWPTRP